MNQSMLLISSTWDNEPTFKMMPVTTDCPFNEAIYDPKTPALFVVGKEKKQSFHMITKLDSKGDPIITRGSGTVQKERKLIETYYEYCITDKAQILSFIKMMAVNTDSFDLSQLNAAEQEPLAQAA